MPKAVTGGEQVVIIWFGIWPEIDMGSDGAWGGPTSSSKPAGRYVTYERTDDGDDWMLI